MSVDTLKINERAWLNVLSMKLGGDSTARLIMGKLKMVYRHFNMRFTTDGAIDRGESSHGTRALKCTSSFLYHRCELRHVMIVHWYRYARKRWRRVVKFSQTWVSNYIYMHHDISRDPAAMVIEYAQARYYQLYWHCFRRHYYICHRCLITVSSITISIIASLSGFTQPW